MRYRLGNTGIRVEQGDITDTDVDAVVNAANNLLYMRSGVAGTIKRKGGAEVEEEAVSLGPIPVGSAVITSAGELKANYVVHAAVMGVDLITDADKIRSATLAALRLASESGIKSIAFPALGTGVGGFPFNEAARIMYDALRTHLSAATSIKHIVFVLYGYEAYNEFLARAEKDFKDVKVKNG